ncbi:hypothetical protein HYPSUDRAFT_677033 [Hypholoma sublateritium FD-334 SS-4]|uniref:Uncharacterized protein n=1 Tax=Hypholoma sublateritium (strain FD-334 SS-4) TaxID=945553 RepID=A0A0D2L4Y9_HYPSF|nr:hypothetical protein HYPSUDRAFT_677033 [Hypholoma sublateritium FD-334 SS-4]
MKRVAKIHDTHQLFLNYSQPATFSCPHRLPPTCVRVTFPLPSYRDDNRSEIIYFVKCRLGTRIKPLSYLFPVTLLLVLYVALRQPCVIDFSALESGCWAVLPPGGDILPSTSTLHTLMLFHNYMERSLPSLCSTKRSARINRWPPILHSRLFYIIFYCHAGLRSPSFSAFLVSENCLNLSVSCGRSSRDNSAICSKRSILDTSFFLLCEFLGYIYFRATRTSDRFYTSRRSTTGVFLCVHRAQS